MTDSQQDQKAHVGAVHPSTINSLNSFIDQINDIAITRQILVLLLSTKDGMPLTRCFGTTTTAPEQSLPNEETLESMESIYATYPNIASHHLGSSNIVGKDVKVVVAFYDPFVYIQYVVPYSPFVVTLLATSDANIAFIKAALPKLATILEPISTSIAEESIQPNATNNDPQLTGSGEDVLTT